MSSAPDQIQTELHPPASLLKSNRYALFWVASLFSNIGTWMQQVAQPWVILSLSHSSFLVGVDSFALNAPGWALTMWGGHLADHRDRKRVILFFQTIQLLAILALVILLFVGWLKPWMIILISLTVGATDALSMPAFQTLVPSLVTTDEIPQAVSLNAIQFNLSRMIGPAIAGVVMTSMGALACFAANAVSFLPFFFSILWIAPRKDHPVPTVTAPTQHPLSVRDIIADRRTFYLLLTAFLTTFFGHSLVTFCPVVVKELIGGGETQFGWTYTAFGVGCLLGSLVNYFFNSKITGRAPAVLGLLLGGAVAAVGLNHSLALLILLMGLAGLLTTAATTATMAQIQMAAHDKSRGRIAGLYQLAFRGGLSLGAIATGTLVSSLKIGPALCTNGILMAVFQLVLALLWKKSY
jgi:MFS family permease